MPKPMFAAAFAALISIAGPAAAVGSIADVRSSTARPARAFWR